MGCTLGDHKTTNNDKTLKETLSSQAQECVNNPTVIIFKEF